MNISKAAYLAAAVWLFADCVPPRAALSVEQRYLNDLVQCIEKSHTRVEADLCRGTVDRKYGVDDGSR